MPNLNRIQIIGRLGKDPVSKETTKGTKYTVFTVAVNRHWKDSGGKTQKGTDWFNVEAWGCMGEICLEYLAKGKLIYLEGPLRTDRYEKDGDVKFFTKVVARKMQMLDSQPQDKKDPGVTELEEETPEEE